MATPVVKEPTIKAVKVKDILERVEIPTRAISDKIEELAADAKVMLGYNLLADRVLAPVKLVAVLKQLDIKPYKNETVNHYKEEKLAEVREARKNEKGRRRSMYGRYYKETVSWKLINIEDYEKAVPEFALRKAVQIKRACPDAQVQVEEIVLTKHRPVPRNFDPFLVVSQGPERYYIDVWDESKFESKLF